MLGASLRLWDGSTVFCCYFDKLRLDDMASLQDELNITCTSFTLECRGGAVDKVLTLANKVVNITTVGTLGAVGVSAILAWRTENPGEFLQALTTGILGTIQNAFLQYVTGGSLTVEVVAKTKEAADVLMKVYKSGEMLISLNKAIAEYASKFHQYEPIHFDSVTLVNCNERVVTKEELKKVEQLSASSFNSFKQNKTPLSLPYYIKPSQIKLQRNYGAGNALLGTGGFGSVLLCTYKPVGFCAVKCMPSSHHKLFGEEIEERFRREAGIILKADHPNIVRVFGITNWVGSFGIIMEYMERGNLSVLIKSARGHDFQIPFDLLLRILLQVANGVAFMHKIGKNKQIVHGDLKPSNVVLKDNFTAKVADFGGASLRTYTGTNKIASRPADNVAHTPIYTAPERLANLFRPASKASDVYSYGMIIYECLSDLAPFIQSENVRGRIVSNEAKLSCERIEEKKKMSVKDQRDSLVCLEKWMKSCWQFNEQHRPAMKQVRDDLQNHFDKVGENVLVNIAKVSSTIKYTAPNLAPSNERFPIDLLYPPMFRPSDVPEGQKEDQTREKSLEAQTNTDFAGELKKTSSEKGEFAAANRKGFKEDQKLDQPFWIKNSEITLQRDAQNVALLGSGTFGSVFLCHYERLGRCAVKCMSSSRKKNDNTEGLQREAELILKAKHQNIVRVFGVTRWGGSFGIVMEYLGRGNLSQLIQSAREENFQVPFGLLVQISLHVANGVAFLHNITERTQIVHGDLKPSNIVLKDDFTAMVTDFGGATLRTCIQNNYTDQRIEKREHTVMYTAPERLKNLDSVATAASDVYSFGIIVYSCLSYFNPEVRSTGDLEWAIINDKVEFPCEAIEEKKQVCVGNQLDSLVCLEKLMEICWQFDEQHRPAMTHVRDNLQQHFDKVARKNIHKSIAEVSSKLKYDTPTPAPSSQSIPINLLLPPFFRPSDVKPESSEAFLEKSSLENSNFEDNIMSLINLARKALESDTTRCESLIHSLNEELNKLKVKELCPDDCSRFVFEINALCEKINNPESPVFRQLAIHGSKLCLGIKNKAVQTGFHESFSEKLK